MLIYQLLIINATVDADVEQTSPMPFKPHSRITLAYEVGLKQTFGHWEYETYNAIRTLDTLRTEENLYGRRWTD
jgi:hypothetical protein